MRVNMYVVAPGNEVARRPVRASAVETTAATSVIGLFHEGGFHEHEFFSLATEIHDPESPVFSDSYALIVLFGLDEDYRIHFHQYDHPLRWDYFVRAVERGFYAGDPAHVAVYRGVSGGPQAEYLQQLVDFLLSPIPAALAGALAARAVHPLELVDELKARRRRALGKQLRQRGFNGSKLTAVLLDLPQWDATHLADGMGWTQSEAIRALLNSGYQFDEDGLWRISLTDLGRARRQKMESIEQRARDEMDL